MIKEVKKLNKKEKEFIYNNEYSHFNQDIKYNEIKNFPVYDFQAVQLAIEEQEEGLDTEFESELTILPNTIKPYPHDFFVLEHKGREFLFEVNEVNYDTIKSHNYYKVTYHSLH